MTHRSTILTAFAAVLLLAPVANAQRHSPSMDVSPADAQEIRNYTLTMDKIQKMGAASKALAIAGKNHPDMENVKNGKTIDEMMKNLQRYPDAVSAITRNGMNPREYVDCVMALIQTSIAVGFKKAGAFQQMPPEVMQSVSQANLSFTEQHWDEIQKIMGGMRESD